MTLHLPALSVCMCVCVCVGAGGGHWEISTQLVGKLLPAPTPRPA